MLKVNLLKLMGILNISGLLLWCFICGNIFFPPEIYARDILKDTEGIHLVRSGESLNKIAKRYFSLTEAVTIGDLINQIREINGIKGSLIRPKQRLQIPLSRSAPVVAKTIPKERDFESKGIYVNRYSMGSKKIRWLVDDVISPAGNTVILDGKDMLGRLSFPSEVGLARDIGAAANPVTPDPEGSRLPPGTRSGR